MWLAVGNEKWISQKFESFENLLYVGEITDYSTTMIFVFKSRYLYFGYSGFLLMTSKQGKYMNYYPKQSNTIFSAHLKLFKASPAECIYCPVFLCLIFPSFHIRFRRELRIYSQHFCSFRLSFLLLTSKTISQD